MKFTKLFLIFTFTIFGIFDYKVAAQNFDETANVSPQTIEHGVYKELRKLPYYGVFDFISYKVEGTTVTLYGKVAVARNRDDAGRFVKDVIGVTNVVNNIEVLPPSPFDEGIRRQVLRSFADHGLYGYLWEPNPSVRIIVDNGHIALEGFVINRGDYNLMKILANSATYAFSVENHLVIEKEQIR